MYPAYYGGVYYLPNFSQSQQQTVIMPGGYTKPNQPHTQTKNTSKSNYYISLLRNSSA